MNAATKRRETVFGFRGDNRIDFAMHNAVVLQAAKRLNEHLLRDIRYLTLKFGKTPYAAGQAIHNDRRPFIGDQIQQLTRRVTGIVDRRFVFGHARELSILQRNYATRLC